jgi:hypothetical protein
MLAVQRSSNVRVPARAGTDAIGGRSDRASVVG